MHTEVTFSVDAPAERVWAILSDVERWPTWTASMQEVRLEGPLAVGTVARIRQPKLPSTTWTVTEVVPGRSFSWESRARGSLAVGEHEITPTGDSSCDVRLMLDQTGPLGTVVGVLYRGLTRRYVQMEADGLTAAATAP
jgi:uncharacterized protein YndB with AHSA1/START domain